ncbi:MULTISPECIES: hypothetical protein [Metallibacterium]|jgi:hypothetical protein|uniref:hypothetical protein n=1 Tax=Metallibacterium TaxID=1218803 RepID=UPI002632F548|nr:MULTISPECIES: hypothetical protein [Metallibacterium]MBW8074586.1 hypothetical protein [Metallibacterium scheffleri]
MDTTTAQSSKIDSAARDNSGLRLLALLPAALAAALAVWARYGLIEPHAQAQACLAGAGGAACILRELLVIAFNSGALGLAAVLAMALALLWRRTASAALSLALGAVALILYSVQSGALALLVGALLLLPPAVASARRRSVE